MPQFEENRFIDTDRKHFIETLKFYFSSEDFNPLYEKIDWNTIFNEHYKYTVYKGDIVDDELLTIKHDNLIVLGNIQTPWLNGAGGIEGGTLFVLGNVVCDFFNNNWGKFCLINGSLKVNDILLNAFQDSSLYCLSDLQADFFFGKDIWATVKGQIDIDYGIGYCMPLEHKNDTLEVIKPKKSKQESFLHLEIDNSADIYDIIEIMKKRYKLLLNKE